jgi:hypothetical protein
MSWWPFKKPAGYRTAATPDRLSEAIGEEEARLLIIREEIVAAACRFAHDTLMRAELESAVREYEDCLQRIAVLRAV